MTGRAVPIPIDRIVLLLALGAFASAAALRICDPMLPELARTFDTTIGRAAIVITALTVAYSLCQLLFGPLGDRLGKFRVIAWACLASTVGALASAFSPTLEWLAISRALTGATSAALIPLSMAWIADIVALEDRQPILARFMSGQILGLIGGQFLGGVFVDTLGWRWAFGFLGLFYLGIGLLLLRTEHRLRVQSADGQGPRPRTLQRLRELAGSPTAPVILGSVIIESMALFGVLAFIPSFMHLRFGISLLQAGAIVATFGLGGLAYTLFARRWLRLLGEAGMVRCAGLLMGLSFVVLALANHWAWGVASSLVAGLGFYQMHNTLQTRATQMAPRSRGTAVSVFASCFFVGQALGALAGWLIVDHFGARWLFLASALVLPLLGWMLSRTLTVWNRPAI